MSDIFACFMTAILVVLAIFFACSLAFTVSDAIKEAKQTSIYNNTHQKELCTPKLLATAADGTKLWGLDYRCETANGMRDTHREKH